MSAMIHPLPDDKPPPVLTLCYEAVQCTELPAFDPLPTLKSKVLSPQQLKRLNAVLRRTAWIVIPIYACGVVLRFASCACAAPLGRIIAPVSAILHIPAVVVFASGIRTEFAKLILLIFDLWFPLAANTVFTVVFSAVLGDSRVVLVLTCWITFSTSFMQETYFRDSQYIAAVACVEGFILVVLMGAISLELVDEVHHVDLIVAGGHVLSTKDVLVNAIGTLATLMARTTYRRVRLISRQKKTKGTAVQSLGYRCTVALSAVGPGATARTSVVPQPYGPMLFFTGKTMASKKIVQVQVSSARVNSRHISSLGFPPLQIRIVKDTRRYDPHVTLFPYIGSLTPLAIWQVAVLQLCGVTGFVLTIPSIFSPLSSDSNEVEVMGVLALTTTTVFCGVHACCAQHKLFLRVVSSFDYVFLILQLLAAHLCLGDIFSWRWTSACGVASSFLWTQWALTVDALTPSMRRRLHFKSWMPTCGIMLFMIVQLLILLDIMIYNYSNIRDRVFWDLEFLGKRAQFRVISFLWSRVATIFVWYCRLIYILLTRNHENALIMLRGNVEFDYLAWRSQAKMALTARDLGLSAQPRQ